MAVAKYNSPQHLQTTLDQIYFWKEGNNLLFYGDRSELLNFGKSARTFHYETFQGEKIEAKENVRDLGIIFEPKRKFDKHITSVVAKGNRMVGWILRMFRTRTKEVMLSLLKTRLYYK